MFHVRKNAGGYFGYVVGMVTLPETSALVVGRMFGKNNFSYFISPKKTWEGFVGQYLGIPAALVVIYLMVVMFKIELWNEYSVLELLLGGVIITTFAIIGDLMESILKRAAEIKDSGKSSYIGKGLGGILDKFDSMGVASIVMALLIRWVRPQHYPF